MKECRLYKLGGSEHIRCLACANKCLIKEGSVGLCGVRKNIDKKLFLLVYGKILAENVDPIEKKPIYNFLPGTYTYSIGTAGCNFKCSFCQNFEISQLKAFSEKNVPGRKVTPDEIICRAIKSGCKSIAYTYNEPAIFAEFVKDCAMAAKKAGLKNILVSNGYLSRECFDFISDYIDAMNIDLKSFSERFYLTYCGAKLEPVLETIKRAHEKGIHIELTTLIIPGLNDSEKECEKIARFISSIDKTIPWHVSRFFPMYKMLDKKITPLATLEKAYKIGKKYLDYVYIGNV